MVVAGGGEGESPPLGMANVTHAGTLTSNGRGSQGYMSFVTMRAWLPTAGYGNGTLSTPAGSVQGWR